MSEKQKTTILEFNYATFSLEGYSNTPGSSSKLLQDLLLKMTTTDFPHEGRIIDRFENRAGSLKRNLVHISARFLTGGRRCTGRIALIKDKGPMLWNRKDIVEEIIKDQHKDFIEVTNYLIDFTSKEYPVIMIEHNNSGPRLSDLEFYLRQISKRFKIAKYIHYSLLLDTDYSRLDKEITNIFNVTFKLNAHSTINPKTSWLEPLEKLKSGTGYKDVKMELIYQRKKDQKGKYLLNYIGLDYARDVLGWLKKDKNNIEDLEDLKMTYQVPQSEEPIELDFLKNKTTSEVEIPINNNLQYTISDFTEIVGQELNYYLRTGKTNKIGKK